MASSSLSQSTFESDEMPSIPGKGSILCHPENLPTDILYNTSEK
jgi:hypothetical protein